MHKPAMNTEFQQIHARSFVVAFFPPTARKLTGQVLLTAVFGIGAVQLLKRKRPLYRFAGCVLLVSTVATGISSAFWLYQALTLLKRAPSR